MHNAVLRAAHYEGNQDPTPWSGIGPRSGLMELTVGVQLAAPWVWMCNGVLGGVEVEDARAFAKWLGRPIRFEVFDGPSLSAALANAEVDLAIGGLQGGRELSKVALSCRYSGRHFAGADEAQDGRERSHVWAIPRGSAALFASLAFYLWMVRPDVGEPHLVRVH